MGFLNPDLSSDEIIKLLDMIPHDEGGYYQTLYEDKGIIPNAALPSFYKEDRCYVNGIYFFLPEGSKSVLHKIPMNEIWHFLLGDPLDMYEILPNGSVEKTTLGRDIRKGEKLVHVVGKDTWFGTKPQRGYSLVTCVTSPGYVHSDLLLGEKNELLKQFPKAKAVIDMLAR